MGVQKADGMMYAPKGKSEAVVKPGEFVFGVIALDHGHIYGQTNGLTEAGAQLKWVYDPDPAKIETFRQKFPDVKVARSEAEVLSDKEVRLIASAAIPGDRCDLGMRVLDAGKDYFTDKAPLTTLQQLERAKAKVKETGKKYAVYYSERLHVESAVFAEDLVKKGAIGRVLQVVNLAPHRLNAPSRPKWFFQKERYGGIICDIGSHQMEQFLAFADAKDATITYSRVANLNNPDYPELEDFGESILIADNGASHYMRVDWFTPDGLSSWGDGRLVVMGTEGTIEVRKYVDIARSKQGDHVFLADKKGEQYFDVAGKVGFPYFGRLILDCLNRTENAMTQEHAFKAAEICLKAQVMADEQRK